MTASPWLAEAYDLVILDLDGTVYLGPQPIPGAVEAVNGLLGRGGRVAYATNNASRRSGEVATHLAGLGIRATTSEVVTSAQVAAEAAAQRCTPGDAALVVGAPALRAEVAEAGLRPVTLADDGPCAVVQGFGPEVGWSQLAEACLAVRAGATWIATNRDRTLPSPRGELPGNGSLVAVLVTALGREPDAVVGKPAPALFRRAAQSAGAVRPLVVGDRLDTDIAGAVAAGMESLFVLTGASTVRDLLAAAPSRRPTYVAADLGGLAGGAVGVPVADAGAVAHSGGWTARPVGGGVELTGQGPVLHALAAAAAACWARQADGTGVPTVRVAEPEVAALIGGR